MKNWINPILLGFVLAFGCGSGQPGLEEDTDSVDNSDTEGDKDTNREKDTEHHTDTDSDSDTFTGADTDMVADTGSDSGIVQDTDSSVDSGADSEDAPPPLPVFAGGVSGVEDLQDAGNSDEFRANGGGLYLHHSGWAPLDAGTKSAILDVFANQPVTVELGYKDNSLTSWQNAYAVNYHNLGIRPQIITLNAFSSDRIPDVSYFQQTIQAYRDLGVEQDTYIFATFEYQNFPGNIPMLSQNKVSNRQDFQQIISASGGMVIDTPSIVFFRREQNYRDWVIDAVQWTHSQGMVVGIIFSPNNAKLEYDEETISYLTYLAERDSLPDFYFVENYSTEDPSTYENVVGSEDVPHHQLGCARIVQDTVANF